jgi:peptidylprolyl isomerase
MMRTLPSILILVLSMAAAQSAAKTMSDVLAAATPADWRPLDPERTLYVELPSGRVVIELAPQFAPRHVENIRALVHQRYFDGAGVSRAQDNFVVQWAGAEGAKLLEPARRTLKAEFTRPAAGVAFTALPDPDTYAPQVGFAEGFPAARESESGAAWLAHCYGMVGAGRDNDADSGGGAEIYVVIGHAPRQLDRNITLIGRVVQGMELLSTLPRGAGAMGFYEKPEQHTRIRSVQVAADLPVAERTPLEALRTDTRTFAELVEARRNRRDEWYKVPAGRIDLCNVPLPVRRASPAAR